jgi:restriction system protein
MTLEDFRMSVPDYQEFMFPLMRLASDQQEHRLRETVERMADEFRLSEADREELLPSGRNTVLYNRVGWAKTSLMKAGLIESPRRGIFRVTERGLTVLGENPTRIDLKYLRRFPEFVQFQTVATDKKKPKAEPSSNGADEETPEEKLEYAYQQLRVALVEEILDRLKAGSPKFFEQVVLELLVGMGYGGSRRDAAERVGKSYDGGIDGIIKEDRLGLDVIYIQAKRWENTVGRPEVQKFVGALQGNRAKKGVFITTASFSQEAERYAENLDCKVVLIDGAKLAQNMIDFNIGVSRVAAYEIKKVDSDYFEEG